MKLRNKKTGVINYGNLHLDEFESLAELNAEWEDYQEPKQDYYFIRDGGNVDYHWYQKLGEITERRKEIGNYFETKEEAEKAVEKLKAFKRLQDLGFRFDGIRFSDNNSYIEWQIKAKKVLSDAEIKEFRECLHKVFGGEDESKE